MCRCKCLLDFVIWISFLSFFRFVFSKFLFIYYVFIYLFILDKEKEHKSEWIRRWEGYGQNWGGDRI